MHHTYKRGVESPEQDRLRLCLLLLIFGKLRASKWRRTLALHFQWVLQNEYQKHEYCTHLKTGTGDPCAGQVRANASLAFMWRVRDLTRVENFGFALPIGSVHIEKKKVLKNYKLVTT